MSTTLADLRRATLAEQAGNGPGVTTPDAPPASASTEVRNSVIPQMRTDASTEASAQASTPVVTQASTEGRKRSSKPVTTQASTGGFAETVRDALAQKRTHAGGVKATVEMSPELSNRIKRYGLDHGGASVRQITLELLEAFLAEEGY